MYLKNTTKINFVRILNLIYISASPYQRLTLYSIDVKRVCDQRLCKEDFALLEMVEASLQEKTLVDPRSSLSLS